MYVFHKPDRLQKALKMVRSLWPQLHKLKFAQNSKNIYTRSVYLGWCLTTKWEFVELFPYYRKFWQYFVNSTEILIYFHKKCLLITLQPSSSQYSCLTSQNYKLVKTLKLRSQFQCLDHLKKFLRRLKSGKNH